MLNIRITGVDESNEVPRLILEANNQPNNGHSFASEDWDVNWHATGSRINRIIDIKWKPIAGSTDVFPSNQPARQNAKHWKAKVKRGTNYSVYVYTVEIEWRNTADVIVTRVFDPLISIRPSTTPFGHIFDFIVKSVPALLVGLVAGLIYWRKDRMRLQNENKQLKDENMRLKSNLK